jgi:hypothetical protein
MIQRNKNKYKKTIELNFIKNLKGGITGGIEICITYPTEYIKTKMQLYPDKAKLGTIGCAKETF